MSIAFPSWHRENSSSARRAKAAKEANTKRQPTGRRVLRVTRVHSPQDAGYNHTNQRTQCVGYDKLAVVGELALVDNLTLTSNQLDGKRHVFRGSILQNTHNAIDRITTFSAQYTVHET